MQEAKVFFEDDNAVFNCVYARAKRSLPNRKVLCDTNLSAVLRASIEEHGIEARELSDVDGLESAYKKGYLHAAYISEDEYTLYDFPTSLHHR